MTKQPVAASLTKIELTAVPEEAPRVSGPPARAGKVALTLRIEPELHRELRTAAFLQDTTIQDLILRALQREGYKAAHPDG
jgi:predicted HicB family RNase H-like nuclease